jgi:predicted LPLAT superfamily acyltransferase
MREDLKEEKITVRRRGNGLGFWFFEIFLKLLGLKGAYALLYVVALHYLIFDKQAVSGAQSYLKRRFPGSNFLKNRLNIYRLFVSQGKQLIDRFALLSGRDLFDIKLKGYDKLAALLSDNNKGFILLTAHVGNWQIALTTIKNMNKPVYLMMRPEDNPAVKASLKIGGEGSVRIISPEGYLGGVVEAMSVLNSGGIISIMGDRKYGFEGMEVSFLQDKAYFPFGAFSIAAASSTPVVVLLSAKLPGNKYIVDVSNILYPSYNNPRDKREELNKYTQEFANILEAYTQKYPYQCFLFHDVWTK